MRVTRRTTMSVHTYAQKYLHCTIVIQRAREYDLFNCEYFETVSNTNEYEFWKKNYWINKRQKFYLFL